MIGLNGGVALFSVRERKNKCLEEDFGGGHGEVREENKKMFIIIFHCSWGNSQDFRKINNPIKK